MSRQVRATEGHVMSFKFQDKSSRVKSSQAGHVKSGKLVQVEPSEVRSSRHVKSKQDKFSQCHPNQGSRPSQMNAASEANQP